MSQLIVQPEISHKICDNPQHDEQSNPITGQGMSFNPSNVMFGTAILGKDFHNWACVAAWAQAQP